MTRPTIIVEIAFTADPMDITAVWTDVTAYVLEVLEIRRGRARLRDRMGAGTARVLLDNSDGRFTPGNWLSPYAEYLLPMRRIRIRAAYLGVGQALFVGFIERWPPGWNGLDGQVEIEAVDAFGWLAAVPVTTSRGPENVAWRALALLSTAGWTYGSTIAPNSPDGTITMTPAVTLTNEPILNHLLDLAEAEDGQLFASSAGIMTFQGRHFRLLNSRAATVQLLLGDSDDTTSGWLLGTATLGVTTTPRPSGWVSGDDPEHPHVRVALSYDVQDIINESRVTPSSGAEQIASDATSRALYGARARARSLLLTSTSEAADRAAWEVVQNKNARVRFDAVTVSGLPSGNETIWPTLLGLELSDRVEVRVRPPSSAAIVRETYVEQIAHRNLVGEWETTLGLSPVPTTEAGDPNVWMLLDTGQLDAGRLAY